jgi:hypothetical protein
MDKSIRDIERNFDEDKITFDEFAERIAAFREREKR